ncbi:hypothetical protein I6B53_10735 [Schaalia sp. 19OD2882]|uniref:RHS repeat-associated core domain-containing protein n=1 Tax=Schaalia sp. 19OD2882 TaxID=2794089 RepID=UPI001C1EA4C9|nr:RHS repeat-associated core domain-containing protein [Schaalia sp. 19OD2882]QWW19533.1 hypothetical protein I6B53_10735 [Schaalia sp. 19OD2882]
MGLRPGRPTTETVGGQLRRTYHVDPAARSMRVTDHVGDECEEWQWWWNWRGDLVHSTQDGLHTRWEHDLDGRLTRLTRPDGEATRFEYDAEGRVCAFTRDGVGRLAVERDMLGRTVAAHGDGIHVTWQWEGGFLARQVVHQDGQATEVTFQRDQNGRILARTVDGATTSYTYDDAGQLTSARTPDGNLHTFTWDVLGRMTGHDGPPGAYHYSHDQAGQLVRAIGPDGQVDYTYDNLGRRVREQCPTGQRRYTWDENDHLTKVTTLVKDGDRLQAGKEWELTWGPGGDLRSINTTPLVWDHHMGIPVPISAGNARVDVAAGLTSITQLEGADGTHGASPAHGTGDPGEWTSGPAGGATRTAVAPTWATTWNDPWATPTGLARVGEGVTISSRATLGFDALEIIGARVYDPATASFLSTDPLLAPAEAGWGHNPYSYAANNPIGMADPTGLKPVTEEQLHAYANAHSGVVSQAWNAASSWVKDNWQYIAAAAVVTAGVVMCATGVGAGIGAAILIGAATSEAFSAGAQLVTTGTIDPKRLATDIAIGGATGPIGSGVGSAVGGALARTGLCQAGRNILTGAASAAVEGGVSGGLDYLAGPGPHSVEGFVTSMGTGTLLGGAFGGGGAAIANRMKGLTGWACFTGETPVVMADGTRKPIKDIEVGEHVLAHNPHTGADEAREVLQTHTHDDTPIWQIHTGDHGVIRTTRTHRFWVQGKGWTRACDLNTGDQLQATPDAPTTHVTSVEDTGTTATVHNLTIHGLTNYYVQTTTGTTVLAHNTYDPTTPGFSPAIAVQDVARSVAEQGEDVLKAALSQAQLRAMQRHPWLRPVYLGTAVHNLTADSLDDIFGRGVFKYNASNGPDFIYTPTGTNIELSTIKGLEKHIMKAATDPRYADCFFVTD